MIRFLLFIPPALFAALAIMFYVGMGRDDPEGLPSTRVGLTAPPVPMLALPGYSGLTDADLRTGEVTIVNFWASWCPPCRAEHPVLQQMADDGLRLAGVNISDRTEAATAYLSDEGNPFFGIAADPRGRTAIDWGVTAPPETFIVAGDGTVLFRFQGPLIGSFYEQAFVPALAKALADAN